MRLFPQTNIISALSYFRGCIEQHLRMTGKVLSTSYYMKLSCSFPKIFITLIVIFDIGVFRYSSMLQTGERATQNFVQNRCRHWKLHMG